MHTRDLMADTWRKTTQPCTVTTVSQSPCCPAKNNRQDNGGSCLTDQGDVNGDWGSTHGGGSACWTCEMQHMQATKGGLGWMRVRQTETARKRESEIFKDREIERGIEIER